MRALPEQARLRKELMRLEKGVSPGVLPEGLGTVRFLAKATGHAAETLERAESVLRIVVRSSLDAWPDESEWQMLLPQWFLAACAPERTAEETELWLKRWKSLSPSRQRIESAEMRWTLRNWLYWFEPSQRQWYWWDGNVEGEDTVRVAIEVDAWPFPWGAISWLLRAAGAETVQAEG